MDLSNITPIINTIGFTVLAVAIWYTQFKTGSSKVSSEVMGNYERLDEQKTQRIKDLEQAVEEIKATMRLTEKTFIERIAKLEGQLKEKNNQLDAVNKILANRNPELEQVLNEIKDFMAGIHKQNIHQT